MTDSNNEARERVLDVAEKLFMTKGFQAVSMRDIAEALGVRQSSLYYHAPQGKEQLFCDAAVRSLERHKQQLDDILRQHEPDFRNQFHAVARWFVQLDDMDLVRLVRLDLPEISPTYKSQIAATFYTMLMQPIAEVVRKQQAVGNIRKVNANALVGGLLSMVSWTSYFNTTGSRPAMDADEVDEMIDLLLDGCWIAPNSVPPTR